MNQDPNRKNPFIEQSLADAAAARAALAGDRSDAAEQLPHLQPAPKTTEGTFDGVQPGIPATARQDLLPVADALRTVIDVEGEPLRPVEPVVMRALGDVAAAGTFNTGRQN